MLQVILLFIGIGLLVKGAGWLIDGSASLAKRWGMSQLLIGLTIVAFGTSMPELIVNLISAVRGNVDLALGNIIGSNIANIMLALGLMASIRVIHVKFSTVWKEIPFVILAGVVLFLLTEQLTTGPKLLSRFDGIILLILFGVFLYYVAESARQQGPKHMMRVILHPKRRSVLLVIAGFAGLYLGGLWTVNGAIYVANYFGMSSFLISATIVAIGTSLPEVVTTLVALFKNETDLAVGNIIGSNVFNIFWVLGITSMIRPMDIPAFVSVDIAIMIASSLLLFLFMFTGVKHRLERWEGFSLLGLYVLYIIFLVVRG
ncbi:calcium/sodium antiporter [Candidatus Woesearchaeota archaeon]|nr:calcium/sodium antiporter [Candidatus Woesearchaeota archaeon]